MKTIYKYLGIIILLVIVFFMGKGCQPEPSHFNTDSIVKAVRLQENRLLPMKAASKSQANTIYKDRHHWHTIRRDSLVPCETKLAACDTIIVHDSIHDVTQEAIIAIQDSVISGWHIVHAQDSTALVKAGKEVRRQKRRVAMWKVIAGISAGLNGWQAIK